MTKKTDTPAIRFKGFSDTWEQRKVGDLLIERNQQAPMSDEYPLMAFIANEGVAPKGDRYDRSALVTDTANKLYKKTEIGDFIYSSNNLETGSIGLNKYGKACISPVYSIFEPTGIADSDFLGRRLVRKDFINAMVKWRQGVIYGQWRIHESDFLKIEIPVPTVVEQRKIGAYLDQLDRLITLHQRKYEKLHNIKKSMLEKMFPKNGSNVPEIRFKGFTEAWEQRKVAELGKIYIGLVTTMTAHYTDEGTLLIRNSDIKDGRFEFGEKPIFLEKSFAMANESRMHQIGDVITVHTGDVGTSAVISENEDKSIGFATIVTRPNKTIIDPSYLCTFLNTERHKKWAVAISTGDGRTNYNLGDYFELVVPVPSIKEQKQIAMFIENLNNLITLHQRELEKLQNIKKSMLEKMFV